MQQQQKSVVSLLFQLFAVGTFVLLTGAAGVY